MVHPQFQLLRYEPKGLHMVFDIDAFSLLARMSRKQRQDYLLQLYKQKGMPVILELAANKRALSVPEFKPLSKTEDSNEVNLSQVLKSIAYLARLSTSPPRALGIAEYTLVNFILKPFLFRVTYEDLTPYRTGRTYYEILKEYIDVQAPQLTEEKPKIQCGFCGNTYVDNHLVIEGTTCRFCVKKLKEFAAGRCYEFSIPKTIFNIPHLALEPLCVPSEYLYNQWVFTNLPNEILASPIGHPKEPLRDEPLEFEEFTKRIINVDI